MQPSHPLHASYSNRVFRQWHAFNSALRPDNFIYPIFISDNPDGDEIISSLIDQRRVGVNVLTKYLHPLVKLGLKCVLLFGTANESLKDERGSAGDHPDNPVILAVRLLKRCFPDLIIACDVCLCAYTEHGHCGFLNSDCSVNNEISVKRITEIATAYAIAGADIVAPSDMMDGRVSAIKNALINVGLAEKVAIMSYSAKFASCFYGPFRDAAKSAPAFGDRRCYQLPPGSKELAIRAALRDANEGAHFIMVKPGLPYLDIVNELRNALPLHPLVVYHVSGEYAMLRHGAASGAVDLKQACLEIMTSFRRAGASLIITYLTPYLLELNLSSETCL